MSSDQQPDEPPHTTAEATETDTAIAPTSESLVADNDAGAETSELNAEPPAPATPVTSETPPDAVVEQPQPATALSSSLEQTTPDADPAVDVNEPTSATPAEDPATAPRGASASSSTARKRKGKGAAKHAAPPPRAGAAAGSASARQSAHGRQAIAEANHAGLTEAMQPGWSRGGFVGMSTGLHLNGEQLTTAEENMRFRRRNKVRPTFTGPVYVAEDVHVPCQACGGPVDPIRRVPVGKLFYHPGCVSCYLCGRTGVTEPFQQVGTHQVICSYCSAKGHAPCVRKEEAEGRGVVLGAVRGNPDKLLLECQTEERLAMATQSVNQATLTGAVAPTLTIGPVHTRHNTTGRSFALMQRQQYYTQNDRNILAVPPQSARVHGAQSAREVSGEDASELAAIRARRRSGSTAGGGQLPKLMYH